MYDSTEELLKTGIIDPELAQILATQKGPSFDWSQPDSLIPLLRAGASQSIALLGEPPVDVTQSEVTYRAKDGTDLRAKLYQPRLGQAEDCSLVVLFHGGGFCVGLPENEEALCRNLVQALGAVCLSASYRLAPEFPFPCAIEDAWDALQWAATNSRLLGANTSKGFILGGSSAGANIAAVLSHFARDHDLTPPLTGLYLAVPTTCPRRLMPEKYRERYLSWEQNKDAPVLPVAAVNMFMKCYNPDENDFRRYAILNHPKGHSRLPPTCFMVDGLDPLRDESLIYETLLREEHGIKTKVFMYPGVPHSHWSFFPQLAKSRQFREEQIEAFRWLLKQID